MDMMQNMALEILLASPVGEKLAQTMKTIETVQRNLFALAQSEDSERLQLLKIGTVFQVFLINTMASGKRPAEFSPEDWKAIADKVSKYAILEEGQSYSNFVFSLYADYIQVSAEVLTKWLEVQHSEVPEERLKQIRALATEIRKCDGTDEAAYVDRCLWISLDAMVKLLSTWLASYFGRALGQEYAQLATAVSDLAFEYGRYVLYAKEQVLLAAYIQNQYVLDAQLQRRYEEYLTELQANTERFQSLVDAAFSSEIQIALRQSADLARAAGVKEDEILRSVEDVDAFFAD